jgi:ACS family D-galactonate transporter-like MFS transporter
VSTAQTDTTAIEFGDRPGVFGRQEVTTTASNQMTKRRWVIGVLLGIGVLINYFDRINLSVAAPQLKEAFNLTPAEMGLLFSAFF